MKNTISFGTSCMNRTPHLDHVYVRNIEAALSVSSDVRFILLNYNSQDGMDKWVQSTLKKYISRGIVKYLRTEKPNIFSQAKTKNIVTKNSPCKIVSILDADHELTSTYVKTLLDCYTDLEQYYEDNRHWFKNPKVLKKWKDNAVHLKSNLLVHPGGHDSHVCGRITCYKRDFIEIGGFDETMTGWGYEDRDFYERHEKYFKQPRVNIVNGTLTQSAKEKEMLFGKNNLDGIIPVSSPKQPRNHVETREKSRLNITANKLVANAGREWGVLPK